MQDKLIVLWIAVVICFTTKMVYSQSVDSLNFIVVNGNQQQRLKAGVDLAKIWSTKKFTEAIQVADQTLVIAKLERDSLAWASLLCSKGISNYFLGEYDKAAACYFEAVNMLEHRGKTRPLAEVYELIARLYRKNRELDLALNYYQRAMQIFKLNHDLQGISTIYNESGVVYEYQERYDQAITSYKNSLGISEQLNDKVGIAYALSNLGTVYRLVKQYAQGEHCLKQAYVIRTGLNDTFALALNASDLGLIYQAWGKHEPAITAFKESNKIASTLNYKELLSANYKSMAEVYAAQNKYELAYGFQTQHKRISDSIFNEQRAAQVAELQTKYETQKKDIAIAEQANALSKKQAQLVMALISLLALVLIGILWFNQTKLKQKAVLQKTMFEQQVLRNKVMVEAEEKERIRIARELHDGVGQQLSAAKLNLSAFEQRLTSDQQRDFTNLIQLVDDAVKEVRQISHNMMPSALQKQGLKEALLEFANKLRQATNIALVLEVIGFEKRLQTNVETVLYRVVQESVSNALKHAHPNHITIQLVKFDDYVSLLIEDDGEGFDKNLKSTGIGLQNLISRVELIGGTIEFDSTLGRGTTIVVSVPV